MASSATKLLCADEFWELPERPGVRLELVDGEVVEVPGSTWLHAELVLHIFTLIRTYVQEHKLGRVYPDGLTYPLRRDPDTMRIPDVSYVPQERFSEGGPSARYMDILPALVVEVVSPGNSASELRRTTRDYVDAGVPLSGSSGRTTNQCQSTRAA